MDDVTKQALYSVVRQLLAALGTILIAHGLVNDAQWANLVGAITAAVPIVWGIYNKYSSERKTQVREAVAMQAGMAAVGTTTAPPTDTKGTP